MIVYCGGCGKFYNGAELEKCPDCGSSTKLLKPPTCRGGNR